MAYAKDRVQSRPVDGSAREAVAIIHHPDVRRMLTEMRALTEGARALALVAAAYSDVAHHAPDADTRAQFRSAYEFLVPVIKGWSTEMSLDVTSLGVQVHGGMGFIEETGAAQHFRDARILPIYEGTTAIQANDLVGRKTVRDGGLAARAILAEVDKTIDALRDCAGSDADAACSAMFLQLGYARVALGRAVDFVLESTAKDPNAVFGASVAYLKLAGIVLTGWQMACALIVATHKRSEDEAFYAAKIATCEFFAKHILPRASALEAAITGASGKDGFLTLDESRF
ncbi:3-methylmercaptopropionyl-CoA dehydrogenase [compost metagenome]